MENNQLPIQLRTEHSKYKLKIFHPDKDSNDPYIISGLDEETARSYIYQELIYRVTEHLYQKLRSSFPDLKEKYLKDDITILFAHNKVDNKVKENYHVDFLTYINISEEEAQEIVDEIISSCDLSELEQTIGGNLQDKKIMFRWLQEKIGEGLI